MIDALLKNHFHLVVHENDKPFEQLMMIGNATKPAPCPPPSSTSTGTSNHVASECITMDELATQLSNELHIDVVNKTNLPGKFAIGFNWPPEPIVPSTARGGFPRLPRGLQTALKTDLGLALIPGVNQNKVLVVDYVELPSILELTKASTAY
jgi:uncharacterized protein (TIGR03435 family)